MLIVKTPIGLEHQAASFLRELGIEAEARPGGHVGLVIANTDDAELVEREVFEAEHVIPVLCSCKARIEEMERCAGEIAKKIKGSFGVKVTRRGKHDFSSTDIARIVGAIIKRESGAEVNLDAPSFWVFVEIINENAYFGILPGEKVKRKYIGKKLALDLMKKITVVQLPYLGGGAREMGKRIGRAAQAFEIKKLVIANVKPAEAGSFALFLRGVVEGRKSRFRVQKEAYAREVRKIEIEVENIYMLIRQINRKKSLLIGTDPTGETIDDVGEELAKKLRYADNVFVFCGSRQGIPKGVLRACDYVLDLAPGITYATEHAIPASLIALSSLWLKGEEGD